MPDKLPPLTRSIDVEAFGTQLLTVMKTHAAHLVEKAAEDFNVDGFFRRLSKYAEIAAYNSDADMIEEVKENLKYVAEYYRVQAVNQQYKALADVFDIVASTAGALLASLVPVLRK